MRSIVIHLADTTREAVRTQLSEIAEYTSGDEWRYPHRSSAPVLYIQFYDDYEREVEPGEMNSLASELDQMPSVSIIAHVSGRVPGGAEVRWFTESVLGTFRGLAQDEYSPHYWTVAEIRSQAIAHGHPFFDYEGWHENTPAV
ncbi:hypothetical protein [Gloeobacter violaceus]|nr:hypothetical protein [Gloeobacter violaceus]